MMHSTKISTSKPTSSSTTTTNTEQYHYPPISTLRRASRPSNIDLSIVDHNNTQQANDPGIYSAPICYIKQTNNHHQQHIHHSSQPYTATFQYQPQQQQQQQHLQLHSHHHPQQQQPNLHLYQQQQQQQQPQQQQIHDPYLHHQHTPHTFPLQASPNHYHQCFYFPPSTLQVNVTSNGHQTTNTSQPSTPTQTHNNRLHSVQIQKQQQWSNPVLSPLMVKRMNENVASISMDDDEDPSASIDALVADVDSNSQDILGDQQNKSLNNSKITSTTPADTRSLSPHLYLRSASHILTTPPNPLASDDHPDNKLPIGNNFQKTFSPLPSAGFGLATTPNNNNLKLSSTDGSFFSFDGNIPEQVHLKNTHNDNIESTNQDKLIQPLIINPDVRTKKLSSNNLIHDDNSNHSSTNSSGHNTSSRIFSQMLQSSEQRRSPSSSSPLSTDVKLTSIDPGNNQTNTNTMPLQQGRHTCTHPECNKIFANKSALAKHKLTHSQDRKHKCAKCNKGFKRLDHLNGHMLTHEEEKPHKCRVPSCNRTYCDARSLKRHIENSHQDILAAIHEGGHEEYKRFLPETAIVKTKDLSITNELSIDSVDSNSPRSLIDNEQSFNIRTSTGNKILTTYTFDEEKYVECQICKKTFKSGAALNGHMRLHGGFNETQPTPASTPKTQKPKHTATSTKQKRINSPSTSIAIKKEEQDVPMNSSTNDLYHQHQYHHHQQQSPYSSVSSPSDVHQQQFYDRLSSSRSRSVSSSVISNSATSFPSYTIQNPMSVQPPNKQMRKQSPLSMPGFDQSRINNSNGIMQVNSIPNHQMNGMHSQYSYHQRPSNFTQFQVTPSPSMPTTSLSTNLHHHLLRQKTELLNQDFHLHCQPSPSLGDPIRCTPPPPPPIQSYFIPSAIPNSTSAIINTPVTSPYTNPNASHVSPSSPLQMRNDNHVHTIPNNGMQLSPAMKSTSSSHSSISSSSSSYITPKQRILNAIKQVKQDDQQQIIVEPEEDEDEQSSSMKIVADHDSPIKINPMSGFLIGTPSSSSTSSLSSASSNTHFNYDNILPPVIPTKRESTPSIFPWASQFRKQLSINTEKMALNPIPSTPYTPPPMLSPFRKGPGLYYRAFSQSGETPSIPTTPAITPGGEDSTGPKINIGRDYQAIIPKLRTRMDDYTENDDELLFSPLELTSQDEKALEKFEQLNQLNPFLFSPRVSPVSYPLELVYMLLHEYNGNLQRTLASLLEGTANDIKQCRPIHRYHFSECNNWTKEEIDAFTRALQSSEKNFEVVSRAVGTKTIKQCIEFHYMPKVNISARKILSTGTSSVMTRRRRSQLIKTKQQQLDDETSSSPFSEFKIDDDNSIMNNDSSSTTQFTCDIDECSMTFTTQRACRAHRKEHRRITNNNNNMTTLTNTKTKPKY
ncbi:unnamed protein product [Adineta steineri]|uniref:Uncharacterized protein n=1 Tax=Adineta steineri TaxID=433720 RepID=A0A815V5R5_9BILA|nr:unnamed protein product [Adineta steineri]CAF1526390.1 unnamed protein product [Adineta steineri]